MFVRVSKLCYRSKHTGVEKLLDDVDIYDSAIIKENILTKVSISMRCDGLHDFVSSEKEPGLHIKDRKGSFDTSSASNQFPSITFGHSLPVEFYDEGSSQSIRNDLLASAICETVLSDYEHTSFEDPNSSCEIWPSLSSLPDTNSVLVEEGTGTETIEIASAGESYKSAALDVEQIAASAELVLDKSIRCIDGLSKMNLGQLENCGFHTVIVGCEVADSESKSEQVVEETNCRSKRMWLHLKKFFSGTRFTFQPFLKSVQQKYKEGDIVCVSGKVRTLSKQNHYEMRKYNVDVIEDEEDSSDHAEGGPYPIYPSKRGLRPNFLRDIISRVLNVLPDDLDPIPEDITLDFRLERLLDLSHFAYRKIHQPKSLNEADLPRRRLIFDEFFYLQGRLFQMLEGLSTQIEKDGLLDKYRKPEMSAILSEDWSSLTKNLMKALPYSLTSSQLSAISENIWDLKRPVPMSRLLQAAFMVPTELLAIQHYDHILGLLANIEPAPCKPTVVLLTGSTSPKQARLIRQGLQDGSISMVIGTHSLIADKVEFSALLIAIVDEQHRFCVIQRGRFNSKLYYNSVASKMAASGAESSDGSSKGDVHMAPHILVMSATPIPRSLALALYGDMSLTQITDLPPGRLPVETCLVEGSESGFEKVYQMMEDELRAGGKVYIVYPFVEQSEQLPQVRGASAEFDTISNRFKGYNCGLLHGKLKCDKKDEALRRFRSGEFRILLATQVIEIGVDVPDASMIVVANAERFGIAQLHQLRGRVGRGERKSKCVLFAATANSLGRLKVLEKSSNGFHLANMDLVLRGHGDLLGKKQSGHLPEFPIARLEIDGNISQEAHLAALKILGTSHDLQKYPHRKAELSMRQPLCLLGD